MSLYVIWSFLAANGTEILAIAIILEQFLASNPNIKANSYFQLFSNALKVLAGRKNKV
jgi:hypothetical protein